ncbi:hypothetical protein GCM10010270_68650 [Streptomyces violaceus]|nr:hypothetical protein GCM10010270_68650 [Streptomyces janthinus]
MGEAQACDAGGQFRVADLGQFLGQFAAHRLQGGFPVPFRVEPACEPWECPGGQEAAQFVSAGARGKWPLSGPWQITNSGEAACARKDWTAEDAIRDQLPSFQADGHAGRSSARPRKRVGLPSPTAQGCGPGVNCLCATQLGFTRCIFLPQIHTDEPTSPQIA